MIIIFILRLRDFFAEVAVVSKILRCKEDHVLKFFAKRTRNLPAGTRYFEGTR